MCANLTQHLSAGTCSVIFEVTAKPLGPGCVLRILPAKALRSAHASRTQAFSCRFFQLATDNFLPSAAAGEMRQPARALPPPPARTP